MHRKQSGFTTIEILIVLAIAGFIITIIFLVVPALQRNSRNHQRRADVNILLLTLRDIIAQGDQLPGSCNNKWHSDCWVTQVNLGFYNNKYDPGCSDHGSCLDTQPEKANNVSFYDYGKPWEESDVRDDELKPTIEFESENDHGYHFNRVSIRTWVNCHPTDIGHFTSYVVDNRQLNEDKKAKFNDIAAQFLIETGPNSWQLQCYELE